MGEIEKARKAVVQAWLDCGFCPTLYQSAIQQVERGEWDNKTPVRIALAAIRLAKP